MGSAPTDQLNRLAAIVAHSGDAILRKDMDCIITQWKKGAEQVYGYAADEVTGKRVSLRIRPGTIPMSSNAPIDCDLAQGCSRCAMGC
jgi:PAS domain S-box-containing protein